MFLFKLFALVTLVAGTQAVFRCEPVPVTVPIPTCPVISLDGGSSVSDVMTEYYENDYPAWGSCPEGQTPRVYDGGYFGYPGVQRCFCPRPTSVSQYPDSCSGSGTPECPSGPKIYLGESLGDYFVRVAKIFKFKGVADGCCPSGFDKYIQDASWGGSATNLCYCLPAAQGGVKVIGEPRGSISSESDFGLFGSNI